MCGYGRGFSASGRGRKEPFSHDVGAAGADVDESDGSDFMQRAGGGDA